jgi:hypothetical protein
VTGAGGRRAVVSVACLALLASACSGHGAPPTLAAQVDGVAIPSSEVQRLAAQVGNAGDKETQREALDFLIRLTLLERLATQHGIDTSTSALEVSAADAVPDQELQTQGVSRADFARGLRASRLNRVLAKTLFPDAAVAETAIKGYYDAHPDQFAGSWKIQAQVSFLHDQGAAKQLQARVNGGEAYATVAQQLGATDQGDLGTVTPISQLPAPVIAALGATSQGKVGNPIDGSDGSFMVVYVTHREDVPAQSYDQARGVINQELVAEKQNSLFTQFLDRQLGQTKVQVSPYFGSWSPSLHLVV